MVLPISNFEIPAQFSFQPYAAEWRIVHAETVGWVEGRKSLWSSIREAPRGKTWVKAQIEVLDANSSENWLGRSSVPIKMNRTLVPLDVLQAHENCDRTPDIAGRRFSVLICGKSEFERWEPDMKPGDSTKDAWDMRDEFLNLKPDLALGWNGSLCAFLNKWGLWKLNRDFRGEYEWVTGWDPITSDPGFMLALPQLLREEQQRYRKAILRSNADGWLRTHPLSLEAADKRPFFVVRTSFCKPAIEATITIDHLAKKRFGICKRCHNIFKKETQHKKDYCQKECINLAGVQRWRDKQRKMQKKAAKRNAKG